MRISVLFAAAALTFGQPAWAQSQAAPASPSDAERLAAAREVVELSRVRDYMGKAIDAMIDQSMKGVVGGLTEANGVKTAHDKARLERVMAIYNAHMRAGLKTDMPRLIDAQASLYASVYSLSELRGLVTFYRSPTGQAMIAKMPQLLQAASAQAQAILVRPMLARMPATLAKVKAELASSN